MLYRAYSNPMDLINRYINQGKFGTFVDGFLKAEYDRKIAEAEKDDELKLWIAYVHSYSEESYATWKNRVRNNSSGNSQRGNDEALDDEGIESIITKLFPHKAKPKEGGDP